MPNKHASLDLSRTALFTALGVALGFALIGLPNVELVTATVFIAGSLLGARKGALTGALTEGLFSLFHPLGAPAPPLWIAQVVSMSLTGAVGGILREKTRVSTPAVSRLRTGLAGTACTLAFAVLTTLSFGFTMDFSLRQIMGSFLFGLGFYVLHIASNFLIFMTLVPAVLERLSALEAVSNPDLRRNP